MHKTLIADNITEGNFDKLLKLKERDGYGERTWGAWLTYIASGVNLLDSPAEMIQKGTREGMLETWCQNLAKNLPKIWASDSISALVPEECKKAELEGKDPNFPTGSAIVVGRGPSLFKNKHLEKLAESDYRGTVVCSDGALIEALKAGVDPAKYNGFYSVSVDGNREKIVKWYDHELVDEHAKHITAILCSTVAPNVQERCEKAGVRTVFFHPLYDNWQNIESFTKIQMFMTKNEKHKDGIPSMQAGGNAGACCWVLSWLVMRKSPVALVGMNLGYLPETDLSDTYYWGTLIQRTRGNAALASQFYERVYNPDFDSDAVIDPVFKHYRESFLSMVASVPRWVKTINCTEGGALCGPGIQGLAFKDFLEKWKR